MRRAYAWVFAVALLVMSLCPDQAMAADTSGGFDPVSDETEYELCTNEKGDSSVDAEGENQDEDMDSTDSPESEDSPVTVETPQPEPEDSPVTVETPQPEHTPDPVPEESSEPEHTPQAPEAIESPQPEESPVPEQTPEPAQTPEAARSPQPAQTPEAIGSPQPTESADPTGSPTQTGSPTPTGSAQSTEPVNPTGSPTPTGSPSPSISPTPTSSPDLKKLKENKAEGYAFSGDIQKLVDLFGIDHVEVDEDSHTIGLLEDIVVTEPLSISETIVLNLNGHRLSGQAPSNTSNLISVSGRLELTGGGTLEHSDGDNVIFVGASGTVVNCDVDITSTNCVRGVFAAGVFEMQGGSVSGNQSSGNGAGIVVSGASGRLEMTGGCVGGNFASGSGGGIRVQSGATANISGTAEISNNQAGNSGGGIHVLNAVCNISGNAVVKNNQSPLGGGIYLEGSSQLNLSGDCRIEENSSNQIDKTDGAVFNQTENAYVGGAPKTLQELIDETGDGGTLVLSRNFLDEEGIRITRNITIDFNGYTIEGAGTASGTDPKPEQLIRIEGCEVCFRGSGKLSQKPGRGSWFVVVNLQEGSRLAVEGEGEGLKITSGESRGFLVENSALDFYGGSIHDSGTLSTSGGAIVAIAGEVNIHGGTFDGNRSRNGAVIRAVEGSKITIGAGNFSGNMADQNGGAVYCENAEITLTGIPVFESNKAGTGDYSYGGAIYTNDGIRIQGDPRFVSNRAGFGGAVYSLGKTIINGGEFDGNTASQMGGAIQGEDVTLEGNVFIHNNTAVWGGGVTAGAIGDQGASPSYMNSHGRLYMSRGVTIESNECSDYSGAGGYRGQGGGVWAYDLEIDGDVALEGNRCSGLGGGIYSRHNLKITAGDITGNTADIGGGIFLFSKGFIQGTPENKVRIMDNTALDTSGHQFAGGGIFVEHKVDSVIQGEYGADLQINGVIITDNTARGGGGIGGCGEAIIRSHSGTGMALYGNTATGSGDSARSQDLYLDGKGTLTTKGLGRIDIAFEGLGKETMNGSWHEVSIKNGEKYLEGMRLTASISQEDKALADQLAGVIISGNVCKTNGGGIGGNGEINIGMPVAEVTAYKIWQDNNDEYAQRPESLQITLRHRGKLLIDDVLTDVDEIIDTQSVTQEMGWRYTWSNLTELDDGNQPWTYYVDEIEVPDYIKTISGTIITNTYAFRNFTVKKFWDDGNDIDKLRPESVKVEVLRNGQLWDTAELSEENGWSHFYEKIDRFDERGAEYVYSVREPEVPEGYQCVINGLSIVNRHVPRSEVETPKTSFTVRKIWDDNEDQDGIRPASIEAAVFRNGILFDTLLLSEENGWSHTYLDIDKQDAAGRDYEYTVEELSVPDGYHSAVNGYEITNRHRPEDEENPQIPKTSFTVRKVWEDGGDRDGIRPPQIEVAVYRNSLEFARVTLDANNGWSHTFLEIDRQDADGREYIFTVGEVKVPDGYTVAVDGYTITNSHSPKENPPDKPGPENPPDKPGPENPPDEPGPENPPDKPGTENPPDKPGAENPPDEPGADNPAEDPKVRELPKKSESNGTPGDSVLPGVYTGSGRAGDSEPDGHAIPQTGDDSHMMFWFWSMTLSLAGLVLLWIAGKRTRK